MSGGVDSSVAAHLLTEQGHEVVGVFMRHGEPEIACEIDAKNRNAQLPIISSRADHKQGCCSATDAEDGRRVADKLGIPFYALNLQDQFGQIMDYFVDEYVHGRTPNPCVMCNNWLKFGKLFEYADSIDAEYVATGHYARLSKLDAGEPQLLRGIDGDKDQSYVLFGVARERLKRMLLPIGGFSKPEIRAMAGELDMKVADKKDSQEICFVTSGNHAEFVQSRKSAKDTAGSFVTANGTVVGQHDGIERFTIGQRKGLGIAMGEPYFVTRIDPETMDVVIGPRDELKRKSLRANRLNWLTDPPRDERRCLAQIRYNSSAWPATIRMTGPDEIEVEFDSDCTGVAPGQAVVLYDGDRVLGGGWIL
ncbi:MAG: tRNA 2-thiouridine(34) synthase MnmA [Planctomycetales bacterium]|nr:tRNA 2-thiouridine(34) synthase MnmA [Planctomycetales bacterium]